MKLFGGPKLSDDQKARIPPGQYFTEKWPVLHYGSIPSTDLATWDFRVWGEVAEPFSFTWAEFQQMPRTTLTTDIHCVTRWSRLDASFEGVPIRHILDRERFDPARAVMIGDRKHDAIGARAKGIASIGVTWGYGSRQELKDAGAACLVDNPQGLEGAILTPAASTPRPAATA